MLEFARKIVSGAVQRVLEVLAILWEVLFGAKRRLLKYLFRYLFEYGVHISRSAFCALFLSFFLDPTFGKPTCDREKLKNIPRKRKKNEKKKGGKKEENRFFCDFYHLSLCSDVRNPPLARIRF